MLKKHFLTALLAVTTVTTTLVLNACSSSEHYTNPAHLYHIYKTGREVWNLGNERKNDLDRLMNERQQRQRQQPRKYPQQYPQYRY